MIFVGADHGGFEIKEQIKDWLKEWGMDCSDVGALKFDAEDDYPDFAFAVAKKVASNPQARGILVCRSAAGMVVAANKVVGVRAVAPMSEDAAKHSREHNDANVIGISADWLDANRIKATLHAWLTTPFSGAERHQRRIDKISAFEEQHA